MARGLSLGAFAGVVLGVACVAMAAPAVARDGDGAAPAIVVPADTDAQDARVKQALAAARNAVRRRQYDKAAEILSGELLSGNAVAQYRLAALYRAGRGVARSDERAFQLTFQSASHGYVEAQYSLGKMLASGRGTVPDPELAAIWLERAARAGHKKAAVLLARMRQAAARAGEKAPAASGTPGSAASPGAGRLEQSGLSRAKGWTLLIEAARRGQVETVREIAAADPGQLDARDASGMSALHHAAASGRTEAAKALIALGANRFAVDGKGRSAIAHAVLSGRPETLAALLEAGVNGNIADSRGVAPLELAVDTGHCDMVPILLRAHAGVARRRAGALVHRAAELCDAEVLRQLEGHGYAMITLDQQGFTALWHAAKSGNLSAQQYLAGLGDDPNRVGKNGQTPFLAALLGNHAQNALAFLEAGADPNATLPDGATALMLAVRAQMVDVARALLGVGADPDRRNDTGNSALMLAARAGNAQLVRLLLDSGASATLRNKKRERASDIAAANGHENIAELLR